ncbi:radical SAM protein [Acidobacteriota bacterium]
MNLKRNSARTWIVSNPRILYRILRGFFRGLILKKNTLRTLHILPTFSCQATCQMCSVAKFKKGKENPLCLDEYESLAKQAAKMGAIAATFVGGEPLLVNNLDKIIGVFKSHHFYISIVTNGIALDRDIIKKLCSAGLNAIFFGLESLDEEINDTLRGYRGQCRKVLQNIEICKEEGLLVGLCTVLFPEHEERYIELAEFCQKKGLSMALPSLAGVGAAEDTGAASQKEYEQILGLVKKYPLLSVDWDFSYFLKRRCPSGKEKIAITCYGDVLGCTLNHISFGTIREESLNIIWKRAGHFSQFKKNSDRCLAAFDNVHIKSYLKPLIQVDESPVHFQAHPNITPESEPGLFSSK